MGQIVNFYDTAEIDKKIPIQVDSFWKLGRETREGMNLNPHCLPQS